MEEFKKIYWFTPYAGVNPEKAMKYMLSHNDITKLGGGWCSDGRSFSAYTRGKDKLNLEGFKEKWGHVNMHYLGGKDGTPPDLSKESYRELKEALGLTLSSDTSQLKLIHKELKKYGEGVPFFQRYYHEINDAKEMAFFALLFIVLASPLIAIVILLFLRM